MPTPSGSLAVARSVSAHAGHAVAAAVLVASIVGVVWQARRSVLAGSDGEARTPQRPDRPGGTRAVAAASFGAALVHAWVMPSHFAESALYGAFFLVAALGQIGYGVVVLTRPLRGVFAVGAVANSAVVALWLVTRLVAIPLGPAAGTRESFGALDVLASMFELAVVIGALHALRRSPVAGTRTPRPVRRVRPRRVGSPSAAVPARPWAATRRRERRLAVAPRHRDMR